MAKELSWADLGLSRELAKNREDLGLQPADFSELRDYSPEHFRNGRKQESDRLWVLMKSGNTISRLHGEKTRPQNRPNASLTSSKAGWNRGKVISDFR